MVDTLSAKRRSYLMGRVRQRNTAPERLLRHELHRLGLRYRLHTKSLPGTPDLVFRKHATVVFVHGCFWHGHACRAGRLPSTNTAYWTAKIAGNRERDARKEAHLRREGWRVFVVWECTIKGASLTSTAKALATAIRDTSQSERARVRG